MKSRLLLILTPLALSNCSTLTPQERAALLDTGLRIAASRLLAGHGK